MFVTEIVGCGSFTPLSTLLIQMIVECNGFDFESIESSNFLIYVYGIW